MDTQRTRPLYKAFCQVDRGTEQDEIFPEFFSIPPKVGDFVQSQSGNNFRIQSILHTVQITKGRYGDIQSPKTVLAVKKV